MSGYQLMRQGNTPAYAGKTVSILKFLLLSQKHPRVCGEDVAILAKGNWLEETPPRMRGRLTLRYLQVRV